MLIILATLPAVTNLSPLVGASTLPPVDVKVSVSGFGCFTSTVIVRIPFTVLPDTVAAPVPTNFTSFAFFTVSLYALSKASVVLSEDTTHPMFCKSPTVAAAFLFTGASLVPTKSTNFGLSASAVGEPSGVVVTGVVFNADFTPVMFLSPKSTPLGLKVIVVPFPPILVMLVNTGFNE